MTASEGASLATQSTAAALISRSFAYDSDVLPLSFDGVVLTVAVATENPELTDRIRELTRKDVRTVAMPVREIRAALRTLYPVAALRDADSLASQALDEIFAAAIRTYASDVHIEPAEARSGRVRLDIDGVLHHERALDGSLFDRVVSLLKVRGNMNTGESRIPQDGRLSVHYDGRSFDVRASTIPIAGREKIVLRFLQRFDLVPDLEQLGMSSELLARYQRALRRPSSFCVVAGPTGSGKSTTAYASLQTLRIDRANVCSVEDPIEYRYTSKSSLVRQREIGRDVGSYAEALRGVLRADPDVILIGELRDPDVMSACLSASETGHLVFSTLHTSEAAETVQRIVGAFDGARQEQARVQLAQSLRAIVSLRLLPDASGSGRRSACEVLLNSPAIRSQLMSSDKAMQIRNTIETSRTFGMQTLESHLNELVANGEIDIAEARAASLFPSEIAQTQTNGYRRKS
jgi:pilus retraction protein PilT